MSAPEVKKVCPAAPLFSEIEPPEFTGRTWEDLALYVKQLLDHIKLLNADRKAIDAYCSTN